MSSHHENVSFYDRRTRALGEVDDALYGTVTTEAPIARLRDRLEKAHLERALALSGEERVLDLGGGAGRLAHWLAPKVREVVLVDASEALLEVARARGAANVRIVRAELPDGFAPEPASFDIVILSGLLVHLTEAEVERMADLAVHALAPSGRVVLKEPVTTDGRTRIDRRSDANGSYEAIVRPRERYAEIFGRRMPLLYERPTLAHPIPFFLGGTEEAAARVGSRLVGRLLDGVAPLWQRLDPALLDLELAVRATPGLARLLAPLPVLQELYIFGAPLPIAKSDASAVRPSLSVVAIAFDEEECLEDVVRELVAGLAREAISFELVLVDDGSRDGTLRIMQRLAARDPRLRVVPLSPNRGIGGALRAGFDAARGRFVTWVPADGQIDPRTVVELYRRRGEAPMLTTVYVARDDARYRAWISKTLNTIIRLRTGQQAKSGGNYLFRREAWERHAPRDDDTMMISTAFRKNLRDAGDAIVEVPIRARARFAGRSKVLNPRTILRTLVATVVMRRS